MTLCYGYLTIYITMFMPSMGIFHRKTWWEKPRLSPLSAGSEVELNPLVSGPRRGCSVPWLVPFGNACYIANWTDPPIFTGKIYYFYGDFQ